MTIGDIGIPPGTIQVVHLAATLYMTGLIWFVQLVHYPLMAGVSPQGYTAFQREHERRTSWAVGPPMLVEAGTAIVLALRPSPAVPAAQALLGLALLAVLWLSTAFLQVPCHRALGRGFDATVHRRLVATNWIRTVAWTARALLVSSWLL